MKITNSAELEHLILADEIDGLIAYFPPMPDGGGYFWTGLDATRYVEDLFRQTGKTLAEFQAEILRGGGVSEKAIECFVSVFEIRLDDGPSIAVKEETCRK